MRSPVEERGSNCRKKPLRPGRCRIFSIPAKRGRGCRAGSRHTAVTLGLTMVRRHLASKNTEVGIETATVVFCGSLQRLRRFLRQFCRLIGDVR